jgi:hypothetical protein
MADQTFDIPFAEDFTVRPCWQVWNVADLDRDDGEPVAIFATDAIAAVCIAYARSIGDTADEATARDRYWRRPLAWASTFSASCGDFTADNGRMDVYAGLPRA